MKRFYVFFVLSMILAACGAIDETEAKAVATFAALGTPPPPKYQTAAAIYLGLTLTPTPTQIPYGTPTMSLMDFSYTQVAMEQARGMTQSANQQNVSMTQQANELALEREKLAAEQKAESARGTAAAAQSTAEAINAQRTAYAQQTAAAAQSTAEAINAQQTAYANATNTQSALIFIQQTAAVHGQETAVSGQQTAVVQPTHFMWTVTAVAIENRIKDGQAREVELSVRRTEMTNFFQATWPYVVLAFGLYAWNKGWGTWVKKRIFKRDEHGKAPVVAIEKEDGKTAIVKTELMTSPVVTIDKDGNVEQPKTADPNEQSDVTKRAQAIEAISFVPTPYAPQGIKMLNAEFGRNGGAPTVLARNNPAMRPVLNEADDQFVEEE